MKTFVLKQFCSVYIYLFDGMKNLFRLDCFKHHNECIINLCQSINMLSQRESNFRIGCLLSHLLQLSVILVLTSALVWSLTCLYLILTIN